MKPTENSSSPQDDGQKIVVQRRGMLPDTNKPLASYEPEVVSPEFDEKEETRLDDHKVRLEPNENGSINAASAAKSAEPQNPNPAPPKVEPPGAPANKPASIEGENKKPLTKPGWEQPVPQQQIQQHKVDELIDGKKYFVPITHNKKNRSKKQFAVTFTLVLVFGLLAINFLIDAGVIKTGIKPPIDLINN